MWSILLWNPEKGLVMKEANGKTLLLFKGKQYSSLSEPSKEELVINMVVLKQLCVLFWKENKNKNYSMEIQTIWVNQNIQYFSTDFQNTVV